jgi:hypothetical protein
LIASRKKATVIPWGVAFDQAGNYDSICILGQNVGFLPSPPEASCCWKDLYAGFSNRTESNKSPSLGIACKFPEQIPIVCCSETKLSHAAPERGRYSPTAMSINELANTLSDKLGVNYLYPFITIDVSVKKARLYPCGNRITWGYLRSTEHEYIGL